MTATARRPATATASLQSVSVGNDVYSQAVRRVRCRVQHDMVQCRAPELARGAAAVEVAILSPKLSTASQPHHPTRPSSRPWPAQDTDSQQAHQARHQLRTSTMRQWLQETGIT
ncbi:hypothetical protein E2C01_011849 [Portunus trituberculatus]|uniref:Uncharacterized protein n=1 Tax=Portunus trituberculatus TaxID=210409 RepID=A0A5B7DCJ0_PORTR|nr:hypothetical protein [Portunus trituberculatus]